MVNIQIFIYTKKKIVLFLCCVAYIISISGCRPLTTQPVGLKDLKLENDINQGITRLYPDRFKAVHRVILTLAGKNYVLNGYLFVDRPKREIKLIAQNDLGGVVFEVHFIKNVQKDIHLNVNTIKKEWLEKSVLRDLEMIYLKEPFPFPTLFIDQNKDLVVSQKDGRTTQKLIYKKIATAVRYRLNEIRLLENGYDIYRVSFKYGPDSIALYPEMITIKDTKMKYGLQISVRYFM